MRESIGGTWILSIVMTFLALFTAYLAVSVNYAKAFRIKNNIISKIETLDIEDHDSDFYVEGIETDVNNYLISQAYSARGRCRGGVKNVEDELPSDYEFVFGAGCDTTDADLCSVCIFKRHAGMLDNYGNSMNHKYYYTVVDFFKFDIPMLGDLLTFEVKGNSKAI